MTSLLMALMMYVPTCGPCALYDYDPLIEQAKNCSRITKTLKPEQLEHILYGLASIEQDYFHGTGFEIPEELRGMLLATACWESGYNSNAKGDWKTKRGKKIPMAVGMLQFWPWAEKKYDFDRADYLESAYVWMTHLKEVRKKDLCPKHFSEKQKWLAAWTQMSRGRLTKENRFRCYERTRHWKLLKKWKKTIKNIQKPKPKNYDPCG